MVSVSEADLIRWSETLAATARTGLGFTQNQYERERFEEILEVAADMRAKAGSPHRKEVLITEWTKLIGDGVAGYVTPKSTVGAVVGNDKGEILLIQRSDSGTWLYPTGWADVGYSPSEVAVKECKEETGIDVEVVGVLAILDGMRLGFTRIPLYSTVFLCKAIGGELQGHPLETLDLGWFARDALPGNLTGQEYWIDAAFDAIAGKPYSTMFDPPRTPPWEGHLDQSSDIKKQD